jgi:hypothetical protein
MNLSQKWLSYIIWEKTKSFAHAQNVQMWEFSILTMQYLAYYYEWHLGNWPSCIAEIYKHSLNVVQYLLLHRSWFLCNKKYKIPLTFKHIHVSIPSKHWSNLTMLGYTQYTAKQVLDKMLGVASIQSRVDHHWRPSLQGQQVISCQETFEQMIA